MKCERAQVYLNACVDRELGLANWFRVQLHLVSCTSCRLNHKQFKQMTRVARSLRHLGLPRVLHQAYVVAASIIIVVFVVWQIWLRAKAPQALVYDRVDINGMASPISAIYSEGDHLVVRDTKTGKILASSVGQSRQDAFNVIWDSSHRNSADPVRIQFSDLPQGGDSSPGKGDDILILKGGDLPRDRAPTIVFFKGDISNMINIRPPNDGPMFLVKIIDPNFMPGEDMNRFFNNPIISPNKSESSGNF